MENNLIYYSFRDNNTLIILIIYLTLYGKNFQNKKTLRIAALFYIFASL